MPCDDDCQKLQNISDSLHKNPLVRFSGKCNTSQYCIHVNDTLQRDWSGVADTTCRLLQERAFSQFVVSVIGNVSGDTLVNRRCP